MTLKVLLTGLVLAAVVAPAPVNAQGNTYFRTAVLFESYNFDPGLGFGRIRQLTIPVGISVPIGRRTSLALSGGYSVVELTADGATGASDAIYGPLDTEVRLSFDVIPGRLIVLLNGSAPTGTTVPASELSVLGAISSEIIGFTAPTLGAGGDIGGGFVAAVPIGQWAFGFGATFNKPMEYAPIENPAVPTRLRPGAEFRIRTGVEGPLARRTYVRVAGIFAKRERDQLNDVTRNGVGNRIIGYVAVNQGLGNANLTVYGFDVFRSDPQIEPTPTGAAILPRGNLFATGLRIDVPLGTSTTITPNAEIRISSQATSITNTSLSKAGQSIRYGAKVRQQLSPTFALVLDGSLLTGYVRRNAADIDINGFRTGFHLEVRP